MLPHGSWWEEFSKNRWVFRSERIDLKQQKWVVQLIQLTDAREFYHSLMNICGVYSGLPGLFWKKKKTPPFHHSIIPSFHHSIIPSFHHVIIPPFHYSIIPSTASPFSECAQNRGEGSGRWSEKPSDRLQRKRILLDKDPSFKTMAKDDLWINCGGSKDQL